jgi:GxxExxY protein
VNGRHYRSLPEPDLGLDQHAHDAIGAAIEVHRVLGPGFLESVYEEALAIEFSVRGIAYQRQVPLAIDYRGQPIAQQKLDFLVGGQLIVELKAVETLAPIHVAQVISYLRAAHRGLGLLINFNVPVLRAGLRRVVLTDDPWRGSDRSIRDRGPSQR